MTKRGRTVALIIVICLLIVAGCSMFQRYNIKEVTQNIPEDYRESVTEALDAAEGNKGELIRVLAHYQSQEAADPRKLEAASYLIANMPQHSFVSVVLADSLDSEIELDVMAFESAKEIQVYLDSLENQRGELHWKLKEEKEDVKVITSDFLITHIDLAFLAYETLVWCKALDWEEFLEYILPYRGSSEPLSDWRTFFWNEFADIRSKTEDPLELACLINDSCKEMFTFKDIFYFHPTDQGLDDMLKTGYGRCEDMTNFTIYAMRANGLAVTSDYTPYWPDGTNNHAWNALILPWGEVLPFMGCEANPGKYKLNRKIAKVYRKIFSEDENALANQLQEREKVPAWLSGENYLDVTEKYVNTSDVAISLLQSEQRWAYLAVYNSNDWRAIHWGKINPSGHALFTKMGRNIVYLPAYYECIDSTEDDEEEREYELQGAAPPFILTEDGDMVVLDNNPIEERKVDSTGFLADRIAISEIYKIQPGNSYTLYVWAENDWHSLINTTAQADSILFNYYYPNSLYKLGDKEKNPEVRPFTIAENRQAFW
jgi:hypothetical protein